MQTNKESLKEHYVYLATIAEEVDRYDDMTVRMKEAAELDIGLNFNEIILLNGAYKHVTRALRKSWKIISSIAEKEESNFVFNNEHNMSKLIMIKNFREKLEEELTKTCTDILNVTDMHLLPSATTADSIVFYYKMKGDFNRYLAEFKTGTDREQAANESLEAYESAWNTAVTDLEPASLLRLGLALNFAALCNGVLDSLDQAIQVAEEALEPIADIDLVRASSKERAFIIDHLQAYL